MKKAAFFTILFISFSLINKAVANNNITLVIGQFTKERSASAFLFQVIEGKKVEYASTKLDQNKGFAFALPAVKEAFYYICDQSKREFVRIYLKPGDKIELNINDDGYNIIKGSEENKILQQWYASSSVITNPAVNWNKDTSTFNTYFPKLETFLPQFPALKSKLKSKNKRFNQLMQLAMQMDVEDAAMYFLMTPKSAHPKKEQYPSFYKTIIQPGKYASADLLELGEGVDILSHYILLNYMLGNAAPKDANRLAWSSNLITNDTLKGAYVANSMRYKTFEELEENVAPVKKYLITDSMQAAYFRALKAVASFKKGSNAYNFSYENLAGKKVSMNDLKGKVVLIDVWATWCGPCKVEIPHLKKLEEEFKGKNVEFVSISVDVEKDKEKWKNMIAKDSLGGTQLFAGGWSDITKYYDITGIPRFLVFDQNGKIVTADAPRPSAPELKELLENTLQGK